MMNSTRRQIGLEIVGSSKPIVVHCGLKHKKKDNCAYKKQAEARLTLSKMRGGWKEEIVLRQLHKNSIEDNIINRSQSEAILTLSKMRGDWREEYVSPRDMSYTPLQWPTPRLTPRMTPFHEKFMELHEMKVDIHKQMKKFNGLKAKYLAWFENRQSRFTQTAKLIQVIGGGALPKEINTIRQFRILCDFSNRRSRRGITPRDQVNESMLTEYLHFWEEFVHLKPEIDCVYRKINRYCRGVKRLREPELKIYLDRIYYEFGEVFSEDFDFTTIHNERDNLFSYRVAANDTCIRGLLAFIPYLTDYCTRICYWSQKIFLEKE